MTQRGSDGDVEQQIGTCAECGMRCLTVRGSGRWVHLALWVHLSVAPAGHDAVPAEGTVETL